MALTMPWYLYPLRSKTTVSIFFSLSRLPIIFAQLGAALDVGLDGLQGLFQGGGGSQGIALGVVDYLDIEDSGCS